MKQPTEIKEKIRQLKFAYLKKFYREHLSREPKNCIYNRPVVFAGTKEYATRICTYFSDGDTYQICASTDCALSCNAFVSRFERRELRDALETDIQSNPVKYPEIMALSWALEKPAEPQMENIWDKLRFGVFQSWFLVVQFMKRWI